MSVARTLIDATIEMASNHRCKYSSPLIQRLERALAVALGIGDTERIGKLRDTIIAFEDTIAEDGKLGLWGFSFDLLLNNNKIDLSESQRAKLLNDLEARLERISNTANVNAIDHEGAGRAALGWPSFTGD